MLVAQGRLIGLGLGLIAALPLGALGQCTPDAGVKLLHPAGGAQDRFGGSVGLFGDVALVGAYADDSPLFDAGSAHIFRWDGSAWVHEATLIAPDAFTGDQFGDSVALSGDMAVVGAQWDDDKGTDSGSVYVFRYDGSAWIQETKLTASNGQPVNQFGFAVGAVAGSTYGGDDLVVVGALTADGLVADSGVAYIFRKVGGEWVQDAELMPDDLNPHDRFGACVGITAGPNGPFAVVTAWLHDDPVRGQDVGAAYVFRYDGEAWVQDGKLTAPDGAPFDWFGVAGAIGTGVAGEVTAITAMYADGAAVDSGAAYVYRRLGGEWIFDGKLLAADASASDNFGRSVAVLGQSASGSPDTDVIAVGSRYDDYGSVTNGGTVYVYRRHGDQWMQDAELQPGDPSTDKEFGTSVALGLDATGGLRVLAGAWRDAQSAANAGAAYVFGLSCPAVCAADCNGDGLVDFSDYLIFLNLYDAADPRADLNGDGFIDFADYLEFLNHYDAGC